MKTILLLIICTHLLVAQSNWQVYKTPYDPNTNTFNYCDNTGTPPFLQWGKQSIGINYSSLPQIVQTGFSYAVSAWSNQYFSLTSGNDIETMLEYKDDNTFGYAPCTVDNSTGEILYGQVRINMGKIWTGSEYYQIQWNTDGPVGPNDIDNKYYVDSKSEVCHELGHIWGLYHPKVCTGQTMSTFNDCLNLGYSITGRKIITSEETEALCFLYHSVPIYSSGINGIYDFYLYQTGSWYLQVSGGNPHFNYRWEIKFLDNAYAQRSKEIIQRLPPTNQWIQVGTNSPNYSRYNNGSDLRSFYLRCTVTDKYYSTSTSNELFVNVYDVERPDINLQSSHKNKAAVETNDNNILSTYSISCNPNPFNPSTCISYSLPERGHVNLKVFNSIGQEVTELVNETKEAGMYKVNFNRGDLPSGIYIYRINVNNYNKTDKILLVK